MKYSHLVGIMISKTIGCRGLAYFQTNPYPEEQLDQKTKTLEEHQGRLGGLQEMGDWEPTGRPQKKDVAAR